MTAMQKRIPKRISPSLGIIAIIMNASSPDELIIIATRAPKVRSLWV